MAYSYNFAIFATLKLKSILFFIFLSSLALPYLSFVALAVIENEDLQKPVTKEPSDSSTIKKEFQQILLTSPKNAAHHVTTKYNLENKNNKGNLLVKLQETLSKLKPEIDKNPINEVIRANNLSIDDDLSEFGAFISSNRGYEENQELHQFHEPRFTDSVTIKQDHNDQTSRDIITESENVILIDNSQINDSKHSNPSEESERQKDKVDPVAINSTAPLNGPNGNQSFREIHKKEIASNGTSDEIQIHESLASLSSTPPQKVPSDKTTTDQIIPGEEPVTLQDPVGFVVPVLNGSKEERRSPSRKNVSDMKMANRSVAPTLLSIFWISSGFCFLNESFTHFDTRPECDKVQIENETKKSDRESIEQFDLASSVPDILVIPKDQLETYSQFAERVNAEKKNGETTSTNHGTNGQGSKVKGKKNYASPDCGAKLISANQEATHTNKIILPNRDEYMLNKCTDKIWVVVELCESIRPQKFNIANFELFSNLPKDINLFGSHRYPTRDWTSLGSYIGEAGNREIQSFQIEKEEFFKYIKLEVLSHYGTEFFCPVSLFRVYGLSEFEVIDQLEEPEEIDTEEESPEDDVPLKDKSGMIPMVIKTVFSGMMDVIKRGSISNDTNLRQSEHTAESCISLHKSLQIAEDLCFMADSLNYILSNYYEEYKKLLINPFLVSTLRNSYFCSQLANISCSTFDINDSVVYDTVCNNSYACVMLSPRHVLTMCYMYDSSLLRGLSVCDNCSSSIINQPDNSSSAAISTTRVENLVSVHEVENQQVINLDDELLKSINNKENEMSHHRNGKVTEVDNPSSGDRAVENEYGENKQLENVDKLTSVKRVNETVTSPGKVKTNNVTKKEIDDNKPTTPTPPNEEYISSGHSVNKESIIVRLSNKIKVLEQNMSISSQYLEELSRRYKRQMEEMQSQFNATIGALNLTSQTAFERDVHHQKHIEILENKLDNLTNLLTKLATEKENLLSRVVEHHLILLFVEILLLFFTFVICSRGPRRKSSVTPVTVVNANGCVKKWSSSLAAAPALALPVTSTLRRMSLTSVEGETKVKERRRSSEKHMAGTYEDLLIVNEKTNRKKRFSLKRSTSSHALKNRSHSSDRPERNKEKCKRFSDAGLLFFSGEGSKLEEVDRDWSIVRSRKLKKKKTENVVVTFESKESLVERRFYCHDDFPKPDSLHRVNLAPVLDYSAAPVANEVEPEAIGIQNVLPIIIDRVKKEEVITNNLCNRSVTKIGSKFPQLDFSSSQLLNGEIATHHQSNTTKSTLSEQSFPSILAFSKNFDSATAVKLKHPQKGKKKKHKHSKDF